MRLLWRASRRYLFHHPWLLGLSILGVALGVAVVVSIDLANSSARRAFALSAESVTGAATHQAVGATGLVDEAVYRTLRVEVGFRTAAPVVEGHATAVRDPGRVFQVLGIDPLAEAPFRAHLSGEAGLDLGAFMAQPLTALLAAETAAALGLAPGDTLAVTANGVAQTLTLVGLLQPGDERSAQAMAGLLVVDIATAQQLLGVPGRLSRIDLLFADDTAGEAALARVQAALPDGVELIRSSTRNDTIAQMTRAFELNLTALSLLALVVGMFLIYNMMTFSVVQRRELIGRLRTLGVTRREVFGLILGEAFFIGLVGTMIGLLLGIVLGRGLVQLVTQTINDLYYVVTVRDLHIGLLTLVKGVALGVVATLVATLAPAREATSAPATTVMQRSQQETRLRRQVPRLTLAGLGLGVLGLVLLYTTRTSIVVSYGALFALLMAFALVTPAAVLLFARAVRPLMGRAFGLLGRMAAGGIAATLSRTAVAVAALMIAIASTIGVGVMVDSFRETVQVWLGYSLQADVYIQPPGLVLRNGAATIRPEVVARLRATPGVERLYSVRQQQVITTQGPTALVAIEPGPRTPGTFRFKAGDPDAIWASFEGDADHILISEPYSYRHNLALGDTMEVQTDRGPRRLGINGIYYDYASDAGAILMSRRRYRQLFDDDGYSGVALYAAPGQEVAALIEALRRQVGGAQDLLIRSNQALRQYSLDVFDRTFTITTVLRLLAVLVAFIGVLTALMALQLERVREFAVLRASGLTPGQVWRYVTMQTGLMGVLAGLLSIPLGLVLAYVLIFVINRRSFGWTLQVQVAPEILLQALLLALLAALLAGLYPAWKMARANPALALRSE